MIDTAALRAVIEERLRLARSATPWKPDLEIRYGDFGWYVYGAPGGEFEDTPQGRTDAQYYAANDPAFVLRQCERDLRVLDRHQNDSGNCTTCGRAYEDWQYDDEVGEECRVETWEAAPWPCAEIEDLAAVWTPTDTQEQT